MTFRKNVLNIISLENLKRNNNNQFKELDNQKGGIQIQYQNLLLKYYHLMCIIQKHLL